MSVVIYGNNDSWSNPAFTFNPEPTSININIDKSGQNIIELPGHIRGTAFDTMTQTRVINISFVLMSLDSYVSSSPGTGTILDQKQELERVMRGIGQAYEDGGLGSDIRFLILKIDWPEALSSSFRTLNDISITSSGSTSYEHETDQTWNKFFVLPKNLTFDKGESSVNRVKGTMSFAEINALSWIY